MYDFTHCLYILFAYTCRYEWRWCMFHLGSLLSAVTIVKDMHLTTVTVWTHPWKKESVLLRGPIVTKNINIITTTTLRVKMWKYDGNLLGNCCLMIEVDVESGYNVWICCGTMAQLNVHFYEDGFNRLMLILQIIWIGAVIHHFIHVRLSLVNCVVFMQMNRSLTFEFKSIFHLPLHLPYLCIWTGQMCHLRKLSNDEKSNFHLFCWNLM